MKRTVLFAQNARFTLLSFSKWIIDKLGHINVEQKSPMIQGSWEGCLNQYTLMNFECKRLNWESTQISTPMNIWNTFCSREAHKSPNVNWRGFREMASKQIWKQEIFSSKDFTRKINHLCCFCCQKASIKNLIRVFLPIKHTSATLVWLNVCNC